MLSRDEKVIDSRVRGLTRGLATLPQDSWEPLVVKIRMETPPPRDELGVSKSMECDTFSLQCFDAVGWATVRATGLSTVGC